MTSQGSSAILLDYDEDIDRLYGMSTVELFVFGNGSNNELTRTLTIEPTASELARGVTVAGQSAFNVPIGSNPLYIFLRHRKGNDDWVLNSMEIGSPTPGAAIANPSGGPTTDVQARSAINAILNTLRNQSLLQS
ncbi:MAG: hypothetical protein AAGC81_14355 [Pseudomonadota bacterium]